MSYELELIPLAAGMALATAGIVRWAAEARTALRATASLFLLGMMGAMLSGALFYYVQPSPTSVIIGLWISSALMALSIVPVFVQFFREAGAQPTIGPAERVPRAFAPNLSYTATVVALILASEILMGIVFSLASGVSLSTLSSGRYGFASFLSNVVQSPWFLFTMAAEMGTTVLLLRHRIPRQWLIVFAFQVPIMALAPTAIASPAWVTVTVYAGSAAMIAFFVFVFEHIYRHRTLSPAFARYLVRLVAIYAVMMAGLYLWIAYGAPELFALSLVLEMALYFHALFRADQWEQGGPFVWQLRAGWAVLLLATVFVSEVFMGALLDVQSLGAAFVSSVPTLPLSGSPGTVIGNAVYNGFFFLALVTASTWFLLMMGLEMGALVYFKLRETRSFETRVRLATMMGAYAAFVVFFPSIYYAELFSDWPSGTQVPLLGWSMGIGSGALVPSVFLVVVLTYVIMGVSSSLFGRRAICSTFCMAPFMYQGTTIDAMKSFNRSSRVGHKYLGSRFSGLYSATLGVTVAALGATTVLSLLNGAQVTNVLVAGLDPSVFLFTLSFSVLWYVLFVTIPYVGNYNCVTMGWCYTGIIAQAFQKVGFFKLKVRDKAVCRACTTVDCARHCPVGLVDMPGHFRTRGEFRSSKCCGVGDCVEACPYGNMYIYDVRHAVARLFGRDLAGRSPARLPMVSARPSSGRAQRGARAPHPVVRAEPGAHESTGFPSGGTGAAD